MLGGLGSMAFMRVREGEKLLVAANRWKETDWITVPFEFDGAEVIFGNRPQGGYLELPPMGFAILKIKE